MVDGGGGGGGGGRCSGGGGTRLGQLAQGRAPFVLHIIEASVSSDAVPPSPAPPPPPLADPLVPSPLTIAVD